MIVGIAGDAKYNTLRRSIAPTIYLPMAGNRATFEVRTAGNPRVLIPAIRSLLERRDKNLPLLNVYTQGEHIDMLLSRERLVAELTLVPPLLQANHLTETTSTASRPQLFYGIVPRKIASWFETAHASP